MWYVVAAIIIIVVIVAGVVLYEQSLTPSGGGGGTPITMDIYAGEISQSSYGFGLSASSITSPGPQLTFTEGQSYKMNVHNVGTMAHSWAITNSNATGATVRFSSEVNPGAYVAQGQTASVTFTPNQSGSFYYICPVPGHPELGMWGQVVINSGP
jgi:uncharacterized cupredoxin-like copper-binding protein